MTTTLTVVSEADIRQETSATGVKQPPGWHACLVCEQPHPRGQGWRRSYCSRRCVGRANGLPDPGRRPPVVGGARPPARPVPAAAAASLAVPAPATTTPPTPRRPASVSRRRTSAAAANPRKGMTARPIGRLPSPPPEVLAREAELADAVAFEARATGRQLANAIAEELKAARAAKRAALRTAHEAGPDEGSARRPRDTQDHTKEHLDAQRV